MRGFFKALKGAETTPLPVSTPDITKAQVGGWLQFAASTAVGLTLLSPAEAEVLIGASGLVAGTIHIADAIIRKGRAGAVAALAIAQPSVLKQPEGSAMGQNAPDDGEELPPAPTLDGAPEVDVSLDGTGTTPPPDDEEEPAPVEEAPEPPVAVEDAPTAAQEPTEAPQPVVNAGPPLPPPPTPEEIAQAQEEADAAAGRLAALKARAAARPTATQA